MFDTTTWNPSHLWARFNHYRRLRDDPHDLLTSPDPASLEEPCSEKASSGSTVFTMPRQLLRGTQTDPISRSTAKRTAAVKSRDTTTVHHTSADPSFCRSCTATRASKAYLARFKSLLKPLECSACRVRHGALAFSAAQRARPDRTRVCVAHEGYFAVCPHIRIYREELDNWACGGAYMEKICEHPRCKEAGPVTARCWTQGTEFCLNTSWSINLEKQEDGRFFKDAVQNIQKLYESVPEIFCPHVFVTSERLVDIDAYADIHGLVLTLLKSLKCRNCPAEIQIQKGLGGFQIPSFNELSGSRVCNVPRSIKAHWSWVSQLDPRSYNFGQDTDTKHITWCDDPLCATSYEGCRASALMYDAICVMYFEKLRSLGKTMRDVLHEADRMAELRFERRFWPNPRN